MTKEEIVRAKNSKLNLVGKESVYLIINNFVCIDLGKVQLENLVIPDFVECIINTKNGKDNTIISTIEFSSSINKIAYKAFMKLTNLTKISDLDKVEGINVNSLFYGCKSLKVAPKMNTDITEMIGTFLFCESIISAIIPSNVVNMKDTFCGCKSLKETPILPDNLVNMDNTFCECESLIYTHNIPDSVTTMVCTFNGCLKLEKPPKLPSSLINMDGTFFNCESLTEAPIIPKNVTNMDSSFDSCFNITKAPIIPDGVTTMNYTFNCCSSLLNFPKIPNSVKSMSHTFTQCRSLTNLKGIIPSSVESLNMCFAECESLSGTLEINTDTKVFDYCFMESEGEIGYDLIVTGTAKYLKNIIQTQQCL